MLHQHASVLARPLGEKEEERIKESLGKEERGLMRYNLLIGAGDDDDNDDERRRRRELMFRCEFKQRRRQQREHHWSFL